MSHWQPARHLAFLPMRRTSPSTPPPPLPERGFRLPEIVETRLENGLDLIVVRRPSLPLVSVILALPGGAAAEPAGLAGLATLAADLLQRGTERRNRDEIADLLGRVGARLSTSVGADAVYLSASALSEHLRIVMDVLADVSLRPTFPAETLEQFKERYAANLQVELTNPSAVAERVTRAIVFGEHPYGRSPSPASIRAIDRDATVRFWQSQIAPQRAALVVTGDVEPLAAREVAEQFFGDWRSAGPVQLPPRPVPPTRLARQIYLVDRPGSTQAEIRVGHLGIAGSDPDRYRVRVMNEILGGGVRGRLFQNLRERHGYTYGAYCAFGQPLDRGSFQASAAVRNEVAAAAILEMLGELTTLRTTPVPADELAETLNYLTGAYALNLETNGAVGAAITNLWLLGLPLSNLSTDLEQLLAVTAEDVQIAAQRHLHPDLAAITVVGDAAAIHHALEPIAPITPVTAEGRER